MREDQYMRREYHQEKYRTEGKRFHPELNKMGRRGWTVDHMHPLDGGMMLVTYSRPYPTREVRGVYSYDLFEVRHRELTSEGYTLVSVLPAGVDYEDGDVAHTQVLATWEIDVLD